MNKSILGVVVASLLALAGCAADADADDATADDGPEAAVNASEIVSSNTCSAKTKKSEYPLSAEVSLDKKNPRYINIKFNAIAGTTKNNARVLLVHPDGSRFLFATSDNIREGKWTHAKLNPVLFGSNGTPNVSTGDVFRIEAVFDLPDQDDKSCQTFLAW